VLLKSELGDQQTHF